MQFINTIALKLVKVSKLVQRKLIPYRSNIRPGHFDVLEISQDSYFVYGNLTIKSKFLRNIFFVVLLII